MTTIKTLISTVALIAASTVFAQTSNTCSWLPKGDEYGQGVIGKRYAEAGFNLQHTKHASDNAFDTGISANLPVVEGLDLNAGYSYSWYNPSPIKYTTHAIGSSVTLYKTVEDGVKPFISAGLGYSWLNEDLDAGYYFFSNGKNSRSRNFATWGFAIGAEFPYKWFAVIPTIGYSDDFQKSSYSSQQWTYRVEVNSWLTSKIGVFASAAYIDTFHSSVTTMDYGIGVRVRF